MNDKGYVYGLEDPRTEKFFYIGSTDDVSKRYRSHITGNCTTPEVTAKVRELAIVDLTPKMVVIEETKERAKVYRERFWMKHYLDQGHPLVNRKIAYFKPLDGGTPTATFGLSIRHNQLKSIDEKAKQLRTSRSELIREMLDFALENMNLYQEPTA